MKMLVMALTMVLSTTAFAAKATKSCNAYMEAALGDAKPEVRLQLGLKAMASVVEVQLTPAQESKILTNVTNFIAKYPKKQDDFEGMFHFVCTTDLDADEIAQVKAQLVNFENLK